MWELIWSIGLILSQAHALPAPVSSSGSTVDATAALASGNIFAPIASNAPPAQISSRSDHPAPTLGIVPQSSPLETNKFYANLFLGSQGSSVWTHPYTVVWARGGGTTQSWGLSISHTERDMLAYGPIYSATGAPEYFVNPTGIQHMILSAAELGPNSDLTTDTHQAFSVNANLLPAQNAMPVITFPLVQGMGFVTGIYNTGTPLIQTGVSFNSLTFAGGVNNNATFKYKVELADGSDWLIYATPKGATGAPPFVLVDSTTIQGPSAFSGTIQIAKNPDEGDGEASYDSSAGSYAASGSVSGSVTDAVGSYTLTWQKAGAMSQKLLMFALPHHVESMVSATKSCATTIELQTTTKGMATGYLTETMTFTEPSLPVNIGFDPWSPNAQAVKVVSAAATQAINNAASVELAQNMSKQSDLNSMYYSGKVWEHLYYCDQG
jgi:endo-1,3(4)-beta-glucanase